MNEKEESGILFKNAALVLGYIAVKELKTVEEKVAVLARLGYSNGVIATICGSTEGFVAKTKSIQKKKGK